MRFVKPGTEEHLQLGTSDDVQLVKVPPVSPSQQLAIELVERLENVSHAGYKVQLLGRFFSQLPCRVGHNPALDAALRAFLHAHKQFLECGPNTRTNDCGDYAEALYFIRKDLDLNRSNASSETVCAAHILANYEVSSWNSRTKRHSELIRRSSSRKT